MSAAKKKSSATLSARQAGKDHEESARAAQEDNAPAPALPSAMQVLNRFRVGDPSSHVISVRNISSTGAARPVTTAGVQKFVRSVRENAGGVLLSFPRFF